MSFTNTNPTKTVKASEIDDLCTGLRENLAELKGYFTRAERETFSPAYCRMVDHAVKQANILAQSKCRSAEKMQRRANMLERCDRELTPHKADVAAEMSWRDYASMA